MTLHILGEDPSHLPKGRCIDCLEFIEDEYNPKDCHCKAKPNYITQNALRKLACKDFKPKQPLNNHHNNIILGNIHFSMCHDIERATKNLLAKNITPTHLLIGKAWDQKNEDYILSFCKEYNIFIRMRFNKSLSSHQFVLIGKKQEEEDSN